MLKVIEFFAGIGSQKKALDRQNIQNEVVGISEWEVNALIAYDAIHTNDGIDYTIGMTKPQILDELKDYTFSTDGKEPCDLKRVKEKTLRQLYNANKRAKNLGDITKINTLPQANLWTYSFPCQDISVAGKQAGIKKGTRSGLLYEIERLLEIAKENNELPEYLLLENVKNLVGKEFKPQFEEWLVRLDELGYNSYWKILNAKHYGIAQNRERVFAVSIRKDIDDEKFEFPKPFDNGLRLKDFLEKEVDEKYYISDERVMELISKLKEGKEGKLPNVKDNPLSSSALSSREHRGNGWSDTVGTLCARDYKDPKVLAIPLESQNECICVGRAEGISGHDQIKRVYDPSGISPTIMTAGGGNHEPKIVENTNEIIKVGTIDGKNFNENKVVYDTLGVAPTIQGQGHCGNEPKIVQAVGDRGNHTYSVKDHAFTIPANPMSDRGQMVIEEQTICEQRADEGLRFFKDNVCGALRTIDACGDKRVIEKVEEEIPSPELVGGIGEKNFGQQYRQGNRVYDADKTAMCLLSQPVGNAGGNSYLYAVKELKDTNNIMQLNNPKHSQQRVYSTEGISPTICAGNSGGGKEPVKHITPQYRIRKLTEVECYKLMGFDKEDALKVKAVGISNSQMYKQAGNSIVVNVLECIFNALFNN